MHPQLLPGGQRSPDPPVSAERPAVLRRPDRVERLSILLLVLFLLVFPKGGIKVADVPITWGYIGLGIVALWLPLAMSLGAPLRIASNRLLTLALFLPFQLIVWYTLLANGATYTGFAISLLITFFFVPAVTILVFGIHLDRLELDYVFRLIRRGVFAIAVYGIFLFFYRLWSGAFLMIPYLTVNAGDVGGLELKHIDRGGIFKLISTYNNGNIYGISVLLLLPLYVWLEKSPARQFVVKLSLLLTLSRTVWVGMLAYEVLQRVYIRRISFRALATLTGWLLLAAAGIAYLLHLLEFNVSFLLDRRLGGRIVQFAVLESPTILADGPFGRIDEMVYLSVLENFGMIGLATFFLAMGSTLFLHFVGALPFSDSEYKRALISGLCVYLLVAISDGAILYIPVFVFYCFLISLLLSDNESFAALCGRDGTQERSVLGGRHLTESAPPRSRRPPAGT